MCLVLIYRRYIARIAPALYGIQSRLNEYGSWGSVGTTGLEKLGFLLITRSRYSFNARATVPVYQLCHVCVAFTANPLQLCRLVATGDGQLCICAFPSLNSLAPPFHKLWLATRLQLRVCHYHYQSKCFQ